MPRAQHHITAFVTHGDTTVASLRMWNTGTAEDAFLHATMYFGKWAYDARARLEVHVVHESALNERDGERRKYVPGNGGVTWRREGHPLPGFTTPEEVREIEAAADGFPLPGHSPTGRWLLEQRGLRAICDHAEADKHTDDEFKNIGEIGH